MIDQKTQKKLNEPLQKKDGLAKEHESFLQTLISKLESGQLKPLEPRTLFNRAVYDKLSEADQEKTDLSAINIMSVIKQIETLWRQNRQRTFQLQNLVDTVFAMKAKFEKEHGDVFVI